MVTAFQRAVELDLNCEVLPEEPPALCKADGTLHWQSLSKDNEGKVLAYCKRHILVSRFRSYRLWSADRRSYASLPMARATEVIVSDWPADAPPELFVWRSGLILHVAWDIKQNKDWSLLPLLGDMAQDAGCPDEGLVQGLLLGERAALARITQYDRPIRRL